MRNTVVSGRSLVVPSTSTSPIVSVHVIVAPAVVAVSAPRRLHLALRLGEEGAQRGRLGVRVDANGRVLAQRLLEGVDGPRAVFIARVDNQAQLQVHLRDCAATQARGPRGVERLPEQPLGLVHVEVIVVRATSVLEQPSDLSVSSTAAALRARGDRRDERERADDTEGPQHGRLTS